MRNQSKSLDCLLCQVTSINIPLNLGNHHIIIIPRLFTINWSEYLINFKIPSHELAQYGLILSCAKTRPKHPKPNRLGERRLGLLACILHGFDRYLRESHPSPFNCFSHTISPSPLLFEKISFFSTLPMEIRLVENLNREKFFYFRPTPNCVNLKFQPFVLSKPKVS